MITADNLDSIFTFHEPSDDQKHDYQVLRDSAKSFARDILQRTPVCADQRAALRKVREALMTANAAIALAGEG